MKSVTINKGDGYKVRATYKQVGTFDIISIDWEHPNYGYFADGMLWYRSPHVDEWMPIYIASWSKKYKDVEDIKKDYPKFTPFFDVEKTAKRLLKTALGKHLRKFPQKKT